MYLFFPNFSEQMKTKTKQTLFSLQIDQSFLDAMPVDIQQEIMSNIKQSRSVSNLRCKHQKAINLEKTVGKEPKESNISFKKENKEIADQSNQNGNELDFMLKAHYLNITQVSLYLLNKFFFKYLTNVLNKMEFV